MKKTKAQRQKEFDIAYMQLKDILIECKNDIEKVFKTKIITLEKNGKKIIIKKGIVQYIYAISFNFLYPLISHKDICGSMILFIGNIVAILSIFIHPTISLLLYFLFPLGYIDLYIANLKEEGWK